MHISKAAEKAIQAIYDEHGEVKPSVLVKKAKAKTSPLHSYFEWNDTEAAQQFRLIQGRNLIRRVTIIVDEEPEKLVHVPTISNEESKEGSYKPVSVIVQSQDEFQRAFDQALSQLRAAQRAVEELSSHAKEKGGTTEKLALAMKSLSIAETAVSSLPH